MSLSKYLDASSCLFGFLLECPWLFDFVCLQKEELVVLKLIFCTTPEILVQLDMLLSFTGYAGKLTFCKQVGALELFLNKMYGFPFYCHIYDQNGWIHHKCCFNLELHFDLTFIYHYKWWPKYCFDVVQIKIEWHIYCRLKEVYLLIRWWTIPYLMNLTKFVLLATS